MYKAVNELKGKIETIRKTQRGTTLDMENIEKRSGAIDASITNRIEERIESQA